MKAGNEFKKLGTTDFLIRIQFRQHATWQGEIQWLGGKEERRCFFRSFLELMGLMYEAIEIEGKVDADTSFPSWSDLESELSSRN